MTIRRICTIQGQAYRMTDYCGVCGDPMWVTLDAPTRTAGCTGDGCLTAAVPAPVPVPAEPRRRRVPDPVPPQDDDA